MGNAPPGWRFAIGPGWINGAVSLGPGRWAVEADGWRFYRADDPDSELPADAVRALEEIAPKLTPLQRDLLYLMRRANQRGEVVRAWAFAEALRAMGHRRSTEHSVHDLQDRLRDILGRLWVWFAPLEVGPDRATVVRTVETKDGHIRHERSPKTVEGLEQELDGPDLREEGHDWTPDS